MLKIRLETFETNSSSTHTLSIIDKESYDKWVEGEIMLSRYDLKHSQSIDRIEKEFLKATSYESVNARNAGEFIEFKNKQLNYDEYMTFEDCCSIYDVVAEDLQDGRVVVSIQGYDG